MRGFKRNPWLTSLGVLLTILAVSAGQARADASIDKKGSVLVFPKLVADENQDTLVQLTNTFTSDILVHCNYVTRDCGELDFDISLTAQQPTFWTVKRGRFHAPGFPPPCRVGDPFCSCTLLPPPEGQEGPPRLACPEIPTGTFGNAPIPLGEFDGAMYCYEISPVDDTVISRNAIKGEAIIEDLPSGDISAYNAISINGISDAAEGDIDLNNDEYNSCPNWLVLNSYSEGFPEPAFGLPPTNVSVSTELSLVPCTINLGAPASSVNIDFNSYDEYELQISAVDKMSCVYRKTLRDIDENAFGFAFRQSPTLATRIEGVGRNVDGRPTGGGLLGVALETHRLLVDDLDPIYVSAAFNLFHVYVNNPDNFRVDTITPFPLCLIQGNCP